MISKDPRARIGRLGEGFAVQHLERFGYEILERNHRTRWGELDAVAYGHGAIVFCEVKTRRAGGGPPFESLHERKRLQVRRMAASWLATTLDRPSAADLRFDAIGVVIDSSGRLVRLDHLENAF